MTTSAVRREDLISRKSAAAHLGVHPNTLDRAAGRIGLQKHRVLGDNQVFYLRTDIEGIDIIEIVGDPS